MTSNDTITQIGKWEQSGNEFSGFFSEGEAFSFMLTPQMPKVNSFFRITSDIEFRDNLTNTSIHVIISSFINFDTKGLIPKPEDLYGFIQETENQRHQCILEESNKHGFSIHRTAPTPPLESLYTALLSKIQEVYRLN